MTAVSNQGAGVKGQAFGETNRQTALNAAVSCLHFEPLNPKGHNVPADPELFTDLSNSVADQTLILAGRFLTFLEGGAK
jgi:hypothetical protein